MSRTFPPMHMYVPLSIAQQDIEDHKKHNLRLTADAIDKYTEDMSQSVAKYKYETDTMVQLHFKETSTLLSIALDINASQQKYIAQQHADNAKKIAELEAQLASEQMNSCRCYMKDNHKTATNTVDTSDIDIWEETDGTHANACSVENIHAFMQLPVFDPVQWNTNT